jgi:hypothetical protein
MNRQGSVFKEKIMNAQKRAERLVMRLKTMRQLMYAIGEDFDALQTNLSYQADRVGSTDTDLSDSLGGLSGCCDAGVTYRCTFRHDDDIGYDDFTRLDLVEIDLEIAEAIQRDIAKALAFEGEKS